MNFTKRQEEIINVSINIIAENGIQSLTIKNISKKIGISEPAIYRHFENKMDILVTLLSYFKKNNDIILEKTNQKNTNSIQQIHSIFSNHFQQFNKNHALASIIFSEDIFINDKRLSKIVNSIMQSNNIVITNIIEIGQKNKEIRDDIPIEQLTLIIMGSLRLIVKKWKMDNFSFDLEKEGEILWNSIKIIISKK